MSSKPKKLRRPTPIDPIFRVPSGAEDEFVTTEDDTGFEQIFNNQGLVPVNTPFGVLYNDGSDPGDTGFLAVPRNLVVFDQKIRRATGVVVVDIVTQFDEVAAADGYEIRVTKI
jgi:hypothetical protein